MIRKILSHFIGSKELSLLKEKCRYYKIENYTVNDDGSIDVDGDVSLSHKSLFTLPIKFGKVDGSFFCNYNNLISLENAPKIVTRGFWCERNRLTSFKGFPEVGLGDQFTFCHDNPVWDVYYLNQTKEFIDLLNEYDVIRGNRVVETRLRQALVDSDCPYIPKQFNFKNYQLV